MATFNPRCWETEGEELGEAHVLIVVTVHEVAWQLAGSSLRPMLSREQAGPLPAVSSNQERHQVHGKTWRDPQHSQGSHGCREEYTFFLPLALSCNSCSGSPHIAFLFFKNLFQLMIFKSQIERR